MPLWRNGRRASFRNWCYLTCRFESDQRQFSPISLWNFRAKWGFFKLNFFPFTNGTISGLNTCIYEPMGAFANYMYFFATWGESKKKGLVIWFIFFHNLFIFQKFDTLRKNKRPLAQLVERLPYKQRVIGSNPVGPKIFIFKTWADPGFCFVYFCSFETKVCIKTACFIRIQTRIVRVRGEHADRLANTTAAHCPTREHSPSGEGSLHSWSPDSVC